MNEFRYTLKIYLGHVKNRLDIAQQVASMLPMAQWVENKAEVLLPNLDVRAIQTAISLEGGADWAINDSRIPPLV
jgi:hypothetical protein